MRDDTHPPALSLAVMVLIGMDEMDVDVVVVTADCCGCLQTRILVCGMLGERLSLRFYRSISSDRRDKGWGQCDIVMNVKTQLDVAVSWHMLGDKGKYNWDDLHTKMTTCSWRNKW